jgi:hypothetical protein
VLVTLTLYYSVNLGTFKLNKTARNVLKSHYSRWRFSVKGLTYLFLDIGLQMT